MMVEIFGQGSFHGMHPQAVHIPKLRPETVEGATSSPVSSARRRHRERMSPTAGPPSTLTISAVLPPSSETGSTCATRVVSCRSCPAHWALCSKPCCGCHIRHDLHANADVNHARPSQEFPVLMHFILFFQCSGRLTSYRGLIPQ